MKRNTNNFDFLRLVFALFVIITHSYQLIDFSQQDFLSSITHGQLTFSHLGVCGFFTISGYLIVKSLIRSPSIAIYFKKRALRLFPGLLVVLILTVIAGAFFTVFSLSTYFSNIKTYLYIPANLSLYRLQDQLPGVFLSNPLAGALNGSLWTLPYEFSCYCVLVLLFFFRNDHQKLKIFTVLAVGLFFITKLFFSDMVNAFDFVLSGKYMLEFGGYFTMGSLLAVFNFNKVNYKKTIALISFLIITALIYFNQLDKFTIIIIPIFIISIGLLNTPIISNVSQYFGDLSYGIYIYAFPIQQTLIYYGVQNSLMVMVYTMLIAPVFAFASWHLIEKQFLKLK